MLFSKANLFVFIHLNKSKSYCCLLIICIDHFDKRALIYHDPLDQILSFLLKIPSTIVISALQTLNCHSTWFLLSLRPSDCLLGPVDEDMAKDGQVDGVSPLHMPPSISHSHPNAFHVWDQDDVIIPMTTVEESPLTSPLMAVIPYMPSFFPTSHNVSSPSHNQPLPKESDA